MNYKLKHDLLGRINQTMENFRVLENISTGKVSELFENEGVFCTLINRKWKEDHYQGNSITDIEDIVKDESGFYIMSWIAEVYQNETFKTSSVIPFPNWNITMQELINLYNKRNSKNITKIFVARTFKDVKIPQYETELAAAMDFRVTGRYILFPQQKIRVNTGLVIAPPPSRVALEIAGRSGISLNTPIEIKCTPGLIDADYRGEIGMIIKNDSFPCFYKDKKGYEYDIYNYHKLWNWLSENGMNNGNLTEDNLEEFKDTFSKSPIYTVMQKGNLPGIYLINPGDRLAQIRMADNSEIKWETEKFVTEEEKETLSKSEVDNFQENNRLNHLSLVKKMGANRGGGFGSTGVI